jgi:CHAT domain-containing protein
LLVEEQATEERFLQLIPTADIIHLALHGEVDLANPLSSRLILAGNDAIDARDLMHLDLSGSRLVVLSVCYSGSGTISATEGTLSLARLFLAAGARMVVANLRQVQDAQSVAPVEVLHSHLARGGTPMDAFQTMLREAMTTTSIGEWSSWVLLGGYAQPTVH